MPRLLFFLYGNLSNSDVPAEELLDNASQDFDITLDAEDAVLDLEVPCVLKRVTINPHGLLAFGFGFTSRAILPDPS